MKCISHDLGRDKRDVKIIPLSDIHIGSPKCDILLLKEYIKKIETDPNCYAVILGDLLNNSTKSSVGDVYEEELNPMEQMQTAIRMFEPIKDKILCITSGNHERRTYKQDGTDLMWFFAKSLGLEDVYDYASCIVFISVGHIPHKLGGNGRTSQATYTIYCTHGDGQGGRTVGGRANGLERRGQVLSGCDVIITGHTHNMISFKETTFHIDKHSKKIYQVDTTYVNSGSYLKYEQYAELYGMKPTVAGSPTIVLAGSKKKGVSIIL